MIRSLYPKFIVIFLHFDCSILIGDLLTNFSGNMYAQSCMVLSPY